MKRTILFAPLAPLLLMAATPADAVPTELNDDVGFDTPAKWTSNITSGSASVTGSKTVWTNATGRIGRTNPAIQPGHVYRYFLTVKNYSGSGTIRPYVGRIPTGTALLTDYAVGMGRTRNGNGVFWGEVLVPANGTTDFGLYASGFTGEVDGFWTFEVSTGHTGPATIHSHRLMPKIDISAIPPTSDAGSSTFDVRPTTQTPKAGRGDFRTTCNRGRMDFIDPIALPGQPGMSHLHVFWGNTAINAHTTTSTLQSTGNSTCLGGIANRSSYWVPALIDTTTNTPLIPTGFLVYYKAGSSQPVSNINPIPVGLKMINGNATQMTKPTSQAHGFFDCYQDGTHLIRLVELACPAGTNRLWMIVFFKRCWDGVNLDSTNHQSHLAYEQRVGGVYSCPSSHPVFLPSISFNIQYSVPSGTANLRLSSDMYSRKYPGGWSSHGDWWNGWDKSVSDAWLNNCVKKAVDCEAHLLGDGRMMANH